MKVPENFVRAFTNYLDDVKRRRCRRRALKDALAAFESSHHALVEASFDLHFLTRWGAEALGDGDAQALARAWTLQFRYRDEARRDDNVRRLTPAAETFIGLLGRAEATRVGGLKHQPTPELDART